MECDCPKTWSASLCASACAAAVSAALSPLHSHQKSSKYYSN
nr:MAG TPA: hypothetical protein [Crassvirales sp.]DAM08332.1 MAG TPA: hypothetical protein [Caudoviricetes sp.]DAU82843.1 MAG TPA: hypothetical protein [Herelleviridae sp.]DAN99819.1 MAG TPA: hypothetical protein [Caudoviricetes sp.]DAO67925.1 MAG TPA: hypothetical protein [Caudoviricetes sp.]